MQIFTGPGHALGLYEFLGALLIDLEGLVIVGITRPKSYLQLFLWA